MNINKRKSIISLFTGLFLMFIFPKLVSAKDLTPEATNVAQTIMTSISGFFGTLLGPLFGQKEMLSRVFFAILLGMIIFSVISMMFSKSSKKLQWSITGLVTAIALLGIPSGFLESIRTSYGAMGAAILTIIPLFIILVFSLKTESLIIARATWMMYSVYYLAMYLFKFSSNYESGWVTSTNIPYLAGFIIGLGIFFLIPEIRNMIFKGKMEGLMESGIHKAEERKERLAIEMKRLKADEA